MLLIGEHTEETNMAKMAKTIRLLTELLSAHERDLKNMKKRLDKLEESKDGE